MINRFRNALMATALFASAMVATVPAFAVGPIQSNYSTPAKMQTYSAQILALAPASSATDFFTITGSATKTITVRSIGCTGTSTAAGSLAVQLVSRSGADLTGTSTAPTVVPLDSNDVAGTATVLAYTVNPGTLGTLVGAIDNGLMGTVAPASAGSNGLVFSFNPDDVRQAPVLRGITQVLALNANAASFTAAASLDCKVVWTEQ